MAAEARLNYLANLLATLKSGATDERIALFMREVEQTLEGLTTGAVIGLDEGSRKKIAEIWSQYKEREDWEAYEARQAEYDDEELRSRERNGSTEKFAVRLPEDEEADEAAAREAAEAEAYGQRLLDEELKRREVGQERRPLHNRSGSDVDDDLPL